MLDLSTQKKRLKKLARQTAKTPSPKNVHDLRVCTRKLRAGLWLVPKAARTKAIRQCRKQLSQLSDWLGEQRKFDVAIEDAVHFHIDTSPLEPLRKAARAKVKKALKHPQRRVKSVRCALRDLKAITPETFVTRVALLQRRLAPAIKQAPHTTPARHHLRIQVKSARYILSYFNETVPGLETLQGHLGKWHDLVVLSELTGKKAAIGERETKEWKAAERGLRVTIQRTIQALGRVAHKLQDATVSA